MEGISVNPTAGCPPASADSVINLDHGDPMMYEELWKEKGQAASIAIEGWQSLSYFTDPSNPICFFLLPEFAAEIRRIHRLVGNAVADDGRHIVVGNGSSQLFQAALFALSTAPEIADTSRPVPVVSTMPYYSGYPAAADYLRSGLFRWAGDATSFRRGFNGDPVIEVVCSPNNPDGALNNQLPASGGAGAQPPSTIHDLAYYWPQYTSITAAADHEIMLFTVSKCTGHAGARLGWALVKDGGAARRMAAFVELATIGVSKDSQLRAAGILKSVSDDYESTSGGGGRLMLFHFGRAVMAERWERLRRVVEATGVFSLPEFPPAAYCDFMGEKTQHLPAFAWLKYEKNDIEDVDGFLRTNYKMVTRCGKYFGTDTKHIRVSMLAHEETFKVFIQRLSSIH